MVRMSGDGSGVERSPTRVVVGLLLVVVAGVGLHLALGAAGVSSLASNLIVGATAGGIASWYVDSDLTHR
jgi:preprotein translocase subunit SecF